MSNYDCPICRTLLICTECSWPKVPSERLEAVLKLVIQHDFKITAIKICRRELDITLKEAKYICDKIQRKVGL